MAESKYPSIERTPFLCPDCGNYLNIIEYKTGKIISCGNCGFYRDYIPEEWKA